MIVSVVIPAFNASLHLESALESVLAQTAAPLEVIVMDDGSTDDTVAMAERFGVRVERHGHAGISATRNRGVNAARGGLIAFLDADDVWLPDKLERQLEVFAAQPDLELVSCRVEQFSELRDERFEQFPRGDHIGCWLVRHSSFVDHGPFPAVDTGDWMLWLTQARAHGLREARVEEVLYRRRLHAGNYGRAASRRAEYARMLLAHVRAGRQP